MSHFLSSGSNYLIFQRHIERKTMLLEEAEAPLLRQMLPFGRRLPVPMTSVRSPQAEGEEQPKRLKILSFGCNGAGGSSGSPVLTIDENLFADPIPQLPPIDATQFSLFNDSPPMDLDDPDSDSEDESAAITNIPLVESSCEDFCQWFLDICEKKNLKSNLKSISRGYMFAEPSQERLGIRTADHNYDIPILYSWAIVHLLCLSPRVSIVAVSSKPVIKAILHSCETVLSLSATDMPRLLGFLCEKSFLDLQLACSLLEPGQQVTSLADIRRRLSLTEGSSGGKDTEDVLHLTEMMLTALESASCRHVFEGTVCPSNVVLASLEHHGICFDSSLWDKLKVQLEESLRSLEAAARKSEPSLVCLKSHLHLREAIYCKLRLHENLGEDLPKQLGIEHLIRIRSTNELVLSKLAPFHSLPDIIVQYRKVSKTKAVYIDSFVSMMDRASSSIKGVWDQTSSVTGRIYCSRPNLQALPGDHDPLVIGVDVRSIFVASAGSTYISADFCQIELRLLAHLAADPSLVAMFAEADRTSTDVFDSLSETLHIDKRQTTKRVVYGCLYGIGARCLSETLAVPAREAADLLARVDACLPAMRKFASACLATVAARGYLETIAGRRRSFKGPDYRGDGGRQLVNHVVQGSAADVCKLAMVACQRAVGRANLEARLLLTRHDEILWLVRDSNVASMIVLLQRLMAVSDVPSPGGSLSLLVPMRVKIKKGSSLADMRPLSK